MAKKQYGLGKGLGAILPGADRNLDELRRPVGYVNKDLVSTTGAAPAKASDIIRLHIDLIEPNPFQPRMNFDEQALDELSQSIRSLGLIQPITVRSRSEGKYQIVSGERFGQIFLTDTDRQHLSAMIAGYGHDARLFSVTDGVVTPQAEAEEPRRM